MQCPQCGDLENLVVDTRMDYKNNQRIRKRICKSCGYIFRTIERTARAGSSHYHKRRRVTS